MPLKAGLLLLVMWNLVYSRENKRKNHTQPAKKLKLSSRKPKLILSQNILLLTEEYLMPEDSIKMKLIDEKMSKFIGPENQAENLYPNESTVAVFRHRETNDIIWEDSQNLMNKYLKECIGNSLKEQSEDMSTDLFDIIKMWVDYGSAGVPHNVNPFVRELMSTVCDMETIAMHALLKLAVRFEAVNAIEKLINERGVDVNRSDDTKKFPTILHYACDKGYADSCEILLKNRANVNYRPFWGWSPMDHAINANNLEIIKILLRWNARFPIACRKHAAKYGTEEVIDWLKKNRYI